MWNYLFIDNEDEGPFFVQCDTLEQAWEIVAEYFGVNNQCEYTGNYYTDTEAEFMGYDTY